MSGVSSISANSSALAVLSQYAQSLFEPPPPTSATAAPNPYGTVTQSYKNEVAGSDYLERSLDLSKINAPTTSKSTSTILLTAVGRALNAASSVDLTTGVSEINAGALAGVASALEWAFDGLLNQTSTNQSADETDTGGLSHADVDSAVAQAVKQFASGQNGGAFSLSLSTAQGSVVNTSGSSAGQPFLGPSYTEQEVQVSSSNTTLSISLSADGKLSLTSQGTSLFVQQSSTTENGVKGADATFSDNSWFGTYYDLSDTTFAQPQAYEPVDAAGFGADSFSFDLSSHTVIQPATDQDNAGPEIIDETQQGGRNRSSGYGPNGASFFLQEAALDTLTTVAQAVKNEATGVLTAKLTITNTLALSVITQKGQTAFLYARPDGTFGRFTSGDLNTVA